MLGPLDTKEAQDTIKRLNALRQRYIDAKASGDLLLVDWSLHQLPIIPKETRHLDCSHNRLTTLPKFPYLHTLLCSHNQLIRLDELPCSLRILDCSHNRLTKLPPLPATLTHLKCGNNRLTALEFQHDGLTVVEFQNNRLRSPPTFPYTVTACAWEGNFFTEAPPVHTCEAVELIERRINDSHPYAFDHRILLIDSMDLHSLPRELPDWLESLSCDGNHLTTLPALPSGLRYLNVANNRLTSLPALPGRLETLYCDNNRLKHIPELPPYLGLFDCSNNRLTRLPERQERQERQGGQGRQGWRPIAELRCDNNRLTELPASLDVGTLSCYNNPFKTIPPLFVERYKRALWRAVSPLTIRKVYPTSFDLTGVIKLDLGHLHLYTLPTLPSSLRVLNCNNNYLSQLPKLPAGLQKLNVSKNRLKEMPFLPLSMKSLDCSENQLERLTPLLELESLRCSKNRLTYLPTLPSTLSSLACEDNLLPSMPPLPAGLFPYQYKRNPFPAGYTVPYTPAKHRAIQERYATANETHVLDVSGMGLYEIAIPESVVQVRCADNFLRSLPTLPAGLELLECDRNSLVWLPPMPASMNVLLCANNRLSHLPLLPEGLRAIDARNNCLSKALRGLLDHCDIHRRVRGLELGERPYMNYVSPRVAERVQQEFHVMPLKDMVSLQIATGRVGDNSFEVTTGQIIPNDLVLYIASFLCATPLKPTLKERIAWNRTHTVTVSGHPNFLVDAY